MLKDDSLEPSTTGNILLPPVDDLDIAMPDHIEESKTSLLVSDYQGFVFAPYNLAVGQQKSYAFPLPQNGYSSKGTNNVLIVLLIFLKASELELRAKINREPFKRLVYLNMPDKHPEIFTYQRLLRSTRFLPGRANNITFQAIGKGGSITIGWSALHYRKIVNLS